MPIELKLARIQHIGIPVTSLSASASFYAGLEFNLVMDSSFLMQ